MSLSISPDRPDQISAPSSPKVATYRSDLAGLVCGSVAAIIWGGYIAFSQAGIGSGLSAADLAFLRYTTAGLLLLPWLLRHSPWSLAGIGWTRAIVLTVLIGPPFVLIGASGFQYAPLAHSAVIQLGTVSLMGVVLSAVLAREPVGVRRGLGLATIVCGLCITAGPGLISGGSATWKGDLLFALAGTMWAIFTVLQRRWSVCPIAATAVVSVLSALSYGPVYLVFNGASNLMRVDPMVIIQQIVVLGILSGVVALFSFARAVETLGPARASLFPATSPTVAILAGVAIFGNVPSVWQVSGLAVLSVGLLVAIRKTTARQARS